MSRSCYEATFNLATALAFGKGDPAQGYSIYRAMADAGDLDSIVASAICLIEDIAGRDDEEGVRLLREACARGSAQAYYELGTLLLVGSAGLDEDEPAAFECFRQAAKRQHSAGMFMMADCLLEGVGCAADAAGAVPLLLRSACTGHWGARAQLEKMLDGELDKFVDRWFGQAASMQLNAAAE
jgi:TPR repeat protein